MGRPYRPGRVVVVGARLTSPGAGDPEIAFREQRGIRSLAMSVYTDLFQYRELFANLFQRELRAKYKGSLLGVGWSLAYPLLLMGVYTVVFSVLWRAQPGIRYYPLFLLAGLVTWVFFSQALGSAARSLLANANLVKKVRFPRQLVPFSVVATQLVTLAVMLVVLVPINLALLPDTRRTFWLVIPFGILLVALTSGISLMVAAANVLYRDVEHLVQALLLPWFFLTPVLYTFETLPEAVERHGTLVDVIHYGNFMAPMVDAIRDPLYFGVWPSLADSLYTCAAAVVSLGAGALVFRRLDDDLAVEL
jgi:homopolymeric O-antigen transport system permease protein